MEPITSVEEVALPTSGTHDMPMRRAAYLNFNMAGQDLRLAVYWIDVYGGGLFVPFGDETCPSESYGGGRYLIDTVKGSDFVHLDRDAARGERAEVWGYRGGKVVLDFNYAYNPSCAYNPQWVCPLPQRENRLPVRIEAGERRFYD